MDNPEITREHGETKGRYAMMVVDGHEADLTLFHQQPNDDYRRPYWRSGSIPRHRRGA